MTEEKEHSMPESIAMVEIDHVSWVECSRCRALNMADDVKCFICHSKL